MGHDFDPVTKFCRRCHRSLKAIIVGPRECGPPRVWTPDLTDALGEIFARVVGATDRTTGLVELVYGGPGLGGDDPTPDLIVEQPCSDGSSPPFGP